MNRVSHVSRTLLPIVMLLLVAVTATANNVGRGVQVEFGGREQHPGADDELIAFELRHTRRVVERDRGTGIERRRLGSCARRAHLRCAVLVGVDASGPCWERHGHCYQNAEDRGDVFRIQPAATEPEE